MWQAGPLEVSSVSDVCVCVCVCVSWGVVVVLSSTKAHQAKMEVGAHTADWSTVDSNSNHTKTLAGCLRQASSRHEVGYLYSITVINHERYVD